MEASRTGSPKEGLIKVTEQAMDLQLLLSGAVCCPGTVKVAAQVPAWRSAYFYMQASLEAGRRFLRLLPRMISHPSISEILTGEK
jgi:hypothetical protein